jgi:alpha-acetolactate decarboxylase
MAKKYYLINQEVYPVNTAEAGIRIFMDDPFTSGMSIDAYKKHFKKQQEKIGIKTPDSALKNNETFWAYLNKIKAVKLATPSEKKLLNNEMKAQNKMKGAKK